MDESSKIQESVNNGSVHEIWCLLYIHVQMPLVNVHADISSNVRGVNCGLSLHLHPTCYKYSQNSL